MFKKPEEIKLTSFEKITFSGFPTHKKGYQSENFMIEFSHSDETDLIVGIDLDKALIQLPKEEEIQVKVFHKEELESLFLDTSALDPIETFYIELKKLKDESDERNSKN